jgi:hypothetical protein
MECSKCKTRMKEVKVKIQDADSPVKSYQCGKCGYFEFEDKSMKKAIDEIKEKENTLKIRHKVVKLSKDRLGMYFNKHVINSLDLKAGEEMDVSVPDKKHILIRIG